MRLRLAKVIVYVRDMAAQVAFYRDVLGLAVCDPEPSGDYSQSDWVVLDTGVCRVALHSGGAGKAGEDAPALVFQVERLEEVRETLVTRSVRMSDVFSPAPGVLVTSGTDPEGNPFSLEGGAE